MKNMAAVKWWLKVEGLLDDIAVLLCGGLYKEDGGYIAPWLVIYPDANMNNFLWSQKDNYAMFPSYMYNK